MHTLLVLCNINVSIAKSLSFSCVLKKRNYNLLTWHFLLVTHHEQKISWWVNANNVFGQGLASKGQKATDKNCEADTVFVQ